MFLVVLRQLEQKWQSQKKKSGSRAPALQMELSTRSIIAGDREESRKTLTKTKAAPTHLPLFVSGDGDGGAGARLGSGDACGSAGRAAGERCGGIRRSRGSGRRRRGER